MAEEDHLPTGCMLQDAHVSACNVEDSPQLSTDGIMTEEVRHKVIASSPTGTITVCGEPVSCILDTGAETSLMSSSLYHSKLAHKAGALGDIGKFVRLVGANNLDIPVVGYIEAPVCALGQTLSGVFVITKDDAPCVMYGRREQYPILLGCNILRPLARKLRSAKQAIDGTDWDLALKWFSDAGSNAEARQDVKSGPQKIMELRACESLAKAYPPRL